MAHFATDRPVTVTMMTAVLILFGVISVMSLPQDLFPDISKPALTVVTRYEGAASGDLESLVTKKLEEKLGAVKGVRSMVSYSGNEVSRIMLTFNWGTNMDLALMDVREKLDQVKDDLPERADSPVITRASLGAAPVVVMNVSAKGDLGDRNLRDEVERRVKLRLERIDGVAAVVVSGGDEYEVLIELDSHKLAGSDLAIEDVQAALENENISQRGGKLVEGAKEFLIRTVGKFTRVEEIGDTVVKTTRSGENIRLNELLAERSPILKRPKRRSDIALLKPEGAASASSSIELAVFKKPGGNSVAISDDVRALIEELSKDEEQKDLAISISYDEATFIRESLDMVIGNGKQGLILAIIILLVFLRSTQSTVVVSLSMPVSVVAAFILFKAAGMSLNVFSLAGLTLAVGMVVDNAVVVTEAVFSQLSHEPRVKKAVINATKEVGMAVLASTLTTLAVFLPIAFVPGIAGQVFKDLSFTVTFALIFSYLVAFTCIPMLLHLLLGRDIALFRWLNVIPDFLFAKVLRLTDLGRAAKAIYKRILEFAISGPAMRLCVIAVVLVAFVLSFKLMPSAEFFPETAQKDYEVIVTTPTGSTLARTAKIAEKVQEVINKNLPAPPAVSVTAASAGPEAAFRIVFEEPVNAEAKIQRITRYLSRHGEDPHAKAAGISGLWRRKAQSFKARVRLAEGEDAQSVAGALKEALAGSGAAFSVSIVPSRVRILLSLESASQGPEVAASIRKALGDVPGIKGYSVAGVSPLRALQGGAQGDIGIKVSGPDLKGELKELVLGKGQIKDRVKDLPGVESVSDSVGEGSPEIHVKVNRRKAADNALTAQALADAIELAVGGQKATDLEEKTLGATYDIRIRSRGPDSGSRRKPSETDGAVGSRFRRSEDVEKIDVRTGRGEFVDVRDVADVRKERGPTVIIREERQRACYVWVNKEKGVALGELSARILTPKKGAFAKKCDETIKSVKKSLGAKPKAEPKGGAALDDLKLPGGYSIELTGAGKEMKESFGYLIAALAMAILLVYMVMASQFESLIHPFTIMFSVPISLIGAFFALWVSGDNLSLTGFIGIIMLAGIVVNNAILLVDYINILRARGWDRNPAIVEAGLTRMRPIFMTTLTTVLGMLPMALGLGSGAELYKPLAVVVIGGLSFSTLLTLVFIPTMYCLFDDIADLFGFIRFRIGMLFSRQRT